MEGEKVVLVRKAHPALNVVIMRGVMWWIQARRLFALRGRGLARVAFSARVAGVVVQ